MLLRAINDELAPAVITDEGDGLYSTLPAGGVYGADLSRYQASVDIATYKQHNKFVILKLGGGDDGLYLDAKYKERATAFHKAGVDQAGYFFNGPAGTPKSTADFISKNLTGWDAGDRFILDVEGNAGTVWSVARTSDTIDALKAKRPSAEILVYMSASLTRERDWSSVAKKAGLYVASYGANNGSVPNGSPLIESWSDWKIWQFTSQGNTPGVPGLIDRDYAKKGVFDIPNSGPTPAPKPTTKSYTVVSGDTLTAIAAKFKTTIAKLLALNPGISDRDEIKTGQTIKVPA